GDVVAVVAERRRIEGQQPQGIDAEPLQIIEPPGQARKVADAVVVAVEEGADVRLVDDGVLVPEAISHVRSAWRRPSACAPEPWRGRAPPTLAAARSRVAVGRQS